MAKKKVKMFSVTAADCPIPYSVIDLDSPIPYRVTRVSKPSPELRAFVAPRHDVPTFSAPPVPEAAESGPQLKVA